VVAGSCTRGRNVEMLSGLALRDLLGKRLRLMFTGQAKRERDQPTKPRTTQA